MKFNKILIVVILLVIFGGIFFFNKEDKKIDDTNPIKFGAILPLTGPAGFIGEDEFVGMTLAVDAINMDGGINGRQLEVIVEDSQSSPAGSVSAFNKLVDVDKVGSVYAGLTSVVKAVQPIAEEKKIALFAESSDPEITQDFDYTLRVFFRTKDSNELLVKYLQENEIQKIGILYISDEFGASGAEDLIDQLKGTGINVVESQSFAPTDSDLRTPLTKISSKNPEIVSIYGFGPAMAKAYGQSFELGMSAQKIGYLVCGQGPTFDGVKTAIEGTLSVEAFVDESSSQYKKFRKLYDDKYPGRKIGQNVLTGYDSVMMIADAMKEGNLTGTDIIDYILNKKTFVGVAGKVVYDSTGDATRQMKISEIHDGVCQ